MASQPVSDVKTPVPQARAAGRRGVVGGAIGTFVEFYDYGIYGYMTGSITRLFFPSGNYTTTLLLTYAGFAVTFLIRPLGGVVCGYLGDRIGRRRMLTVTVFIISAATAGIGLLGTYAAIGIAAPLLLFSLRLIQGFSAGGEVSGANLFIGEHAPPRKRAFYMSWMGASASLALLCGTLLANAIVHWAGQDAMNSWAWRIPFLVAAPLGVLGWFLRKRLDESPVFKAVVKQEQVSGNPLKMIFRREHRRALWLAFLLPLLNSAGYYVIFIYLPGYLVDGLGYSQSASLTLASVVLAVSVGTIPLAGILADRFGRKRLLAGSAVLILVAAYPCFMLLAHGSFAAGVLGGAVLATLFSGHQGVVHAALIELFSSSAGTASPTTSRPRFSVVAPRFCAQLSSRRPETMPCRRSTS
ncbi:MFS transporter [Saccharopolyspora spinosa]|uniref:MFS transporter n=1 Tax=Saccharopolyspora spinosa TaxID=60894 RepID=UPI0002F2477E|nr:MFS transporter [Saccharopolyspora spinosa]